MLQIQFSFSKIANTHTKNAGGLFIKRSSLCGKKKQTMKFLATKQAKNCCQMCFVFVFSIVFVALVVVAVENPQHKAPFDVVFIVFLCL